jgi:outer membrane protein TolC
VVSEIRQLVLSLETAEEFAESQSRNLETAKEALRLVEVGLREGENSQVEVMDARQALTTASANYYQSIFDHALVRLRLQRAMGTLSDGPLPDKPVLGEKEE